MTITSSAQPTALRNVPLAPVPRQVQVAPTAPISIQSLPAPTPVAVPRQVQMTPVTQPAVPLPMAARVTVRSQGGVTLTPGGTATTAATAPATTGPVRTPSVVLVGTASGDSPTAILTTPEGQMIAGIGDHVTMNDVDYTISKISATSIVLSHLKDTLTLTETN